MTNNKGDAFGNLPDFLPVDSESPKHFETFQRIFSDSHDSSPTTEESAGKFLLHRSASFKIKI